MQSHGPDEPEAARSDSSLRVLVVEDERLLQWAISETLSISGSTLSLASDGASALQALNAASFDLVLMDLCLPDSRDLTLLSNIRRRWPDTSVVLMTAHATPDVVDGARQLGAYTILQKPFDLHGLPAILHAAHLESHQPARH